MIISSKEIGSQEELLQELAKEGFQLTQATLSRDLKQLKVAKAASMNGNYVYVLPNNTMYKRMVDPQSASEMLRHNGFISIEFSNNVAVIKTRPGYASSLAFDIDDSKFHEIIGTIAGDDTIILIIREGCSKTSVKQALAHVIPTINQTK
jgi:transcriptional regulator of arginine metabolism